MLSDPASPPPLPLTPPHTHDNEHQCHSCPRPLPPDLPQSVLRLHPPLTVPCPPNPSSHLLSPYPLVPCTHHSLPSSASTTPAYTCFPHQHRTPPSLTHHSVQPAFSSFFFISLSPFLSICLSIFVSVFPVYILPLIELVISICQPISLYTYTHTERLYGYLSATPVTYFCLYF